MPVNAKQPKTDTPQTTSPTPPLPAPEKESISVEGKKQKDKRSQTACITKRSASQSWTNIARGESR